MMFHIKHFFHVVRKYAAKKVKDTSFEKKKHYGNSFPDNLTNKKQKTPGYMYIATEETANIINEHLKLHFKQSSCDTIVELNPGIGILTRRLLNNEQFKKIILMESMEYFISNLQEMIAPYPDRLKLRHGDMVNVAKIAFQDKLDNGSRLQELLHDIPTKNIQEDPNILLFGAIGSYKFFKHMIYSSIFQSSFLSVGRTEMYFVVPPFIYLHLTCGKEAGYMFYRTTSILFQILFEYRFIAHLPRDGFLPIEYDFNSTKSKWKKLRSVDPDFFYLVKVIPRKNLHKYVDTEDLRALWFFVTQNCISRKNRIIPNLEKWIPGCGPRLIVYDKNPKPSIALYKNEDVGKLPRYYSPCQKIRNYDYLNINIYTQFGDLTPNQMLTLFSLFRKWPEYTESAFLNSLENNLLKLEPSAEEFQEDDDLLTERTEKEVETRKSKT